METTFKGGQFKPISEGIRGPLQVLNHRDDHFISTFSGNNNVQSGPAAAGVVSGPVFTRSVALAGVMGRALETPSSRSVGSQQRAFPAETEAQTAPGASFAFPHGFSSEEIDRWKRLEEQGAPLRAQRLDAIARGDDEAERGAMEALKRLQRVKQVLLERMEELWTEQDWFAARRNRTEGIRVPSQNDQSRSPSPVGQLTAPTDATPQPQPRTHGGVHFPSEIEDRPLTGSTHGGIRSLQAEASTKTHESFERELLGTRRASQDVRVNPQESAQDPSSSALEADGPVCTVSSSRVRTGSDPFTTSERVRTSSGRGKVPRDLPHFRGVRRDSIQDATEFIERFETVCEPYSLDDAQLLRILPMCLDSIDGAWFKQWRSSNDDAVDWEDARAAFLSHFKHPNELTVLLAQVRALKMDNGGVQRYADQFRRLMAQLGWNKQTPEAVFQFKQGLTRGMLDRLSGAEANFELMSELMGKPHESVSVDALVTMALRIEADRALNMANEPIKSLSNNNKSDSNSSAKKETQKCQYCGKIGHLEMDCRKKKAHESRKNSSGEASSAASATSAASKKPVKCFNCGESGHYSPDCPKKKKNESGKFATPTVKMAQVADESEDDLEPAIEGRKVETQTTTTDTSTLMNEAANKRVACLRTPCYLEGQKVMAFVDGGATTSFVDRRWVQRNALPIEPRSGTLTQFVDGSILPRIGVVTGLTLENGNKVLRVDLEVADLSGDEEVIIGIDLFEPLGFQVLGVPFAWPQHAEPLTTTKKKELKEPVVPPPGVDENGIADEWKEVLERNQSISVFDLNAIPNSELHLPTGNHEPVFIRQYPIPEGLRAAVTERVELWKTNHWVVPAPPGCRWNSPILAAKKSGKEVGEPDDIRVCIDCRALNERLMDNPDSRLPLVREIIDHLGPFDWITTLDLADSYHQFKIADEDQEKLAFTWNGEHLMWRVAPFGVKTMPAHEQHQMEELLKKIKRTPFLDDLVIASKGDSKHKHDVLEVLKVLTDEGRLRLRLKKCKFFKTEARVLGFLVTREGVKMDPRKIKAIAEWPKPKDGKAMQRFMGAVNFNREFSSEFAKLTAPLDAARTVKGLIEWTPEMEHAFEALKRFFSNNMMLRRVDWERTMYLTTDACLTGIGAWIGQKNDDGIIIPCICVSKKLTATQQRWSATKRELYALMWAMQKLRHYLLGRWFIARVDHRPLVHLVKNKMNLLLEGWMDVVLQFDFTTEYLPGENNVLADALSRQHESEDSRTVNACSVDVASLTTTNPSQGVEFEAQKRGKIVPAFEERNKLLEQVHSLGHQGVESMFRRLWQQGYWWPKIREDLKQLVHSCLPCLRFDVKTAGYHPSRSVEADNVWDHVEIDLIGPLPISHEGFTFILTIVDVLSGYTVLEPLKDKSMQSLARALWKVICSYGTMKILQSDNGSEFVNSTLSELTQLYGVDHRLITPYHPQANGLVERTNKEVSRSIKKFMEGSMGSWESWLPTVQLGLNVQVHKRTGTTPFALMFGRPFNEFWDFTTAQSLEDWSNFVEQRMSQWHKLHDAILPAVAERSKERYASSREALDKSRRMAPDFKVGDFVMAEDPVRSSKWQPVFTGPHAIGTVHEGGTYTLLDALGQPMEPRRTTDMLRLASSMENPSGGGEKDIVPPKTFSKTKKGEKKTDTEVSEVSYEIEKILDERRKHGRQEYLVHWKGYPEDEATWEPDDHFDDLDIITRFWKTQKKKKQQTSALTQPPRRSTRQAAKE